MKFEYEITCTSIIMNDETTATYTFRLGPEKLPRDLIRTMTVPAEIGKFEVGKTYKMNMCWTIMTSKQSTGTANTNFFR